MAVNGERRVPYQLEILDSEGIAAIHAATVEVLSQTGAFFGDEEALTLLSSAGAVVDDDGLVRIPEALVEQAIDSAPSGLLLY